MKHRKTVLYLRANFISMKTDRSMEMVVKLTITIEAYLIPVAYNVL